MASKYIDINNTAYEIVDGGIQQITDPTLAKQVTSGGLMAYSRGSLEEAIQQFGPVVSGQPSPSPTSSAVPTTPISGTRLSAPIDTATATQYGFTPQQWGNLPEYQRQNIIEGRTTASALLNPPIAPPPASPRLPGETLAEWTKRLSGVTESAQPTTSVAGTSEVARARTIAEQRAMLEKGLVKPPLLRSSDEFVRLRKEQGIVQDEEELLSIRNEALQGKEELRRFSATAGIGTTEGGRLGMISEAERNLNFRLEGLAIREQAVVARLNMKNSYINTVLNLKQEDYNRAYTDYTNEYNKNLKAIELHNELLADEQKDALTALTTINNLFKDKQIDVSQLDPTIKANINSMELKAGLPQGLFEFALSAMPEEKITTPIMKQQADGSWNVYFQTHDAQGNPSLKLVQSLPGVIEESPVDIRQQRAALADLLAQVPTYTDRATALKESERYRAAIVTRVGEEGYQKILQEIDRLFPMAETPSPTAGTGTKFIEAVGGFFRRLFQR